MSFALLAEQLAVLCVVKKLDMVSVFMPAVWADEEIGIVADGNTACNIAFDGTRICERHMDRSWANRAGDKVIYRSKGSV